MPDQVVLLSIPGLRAKDLAAMPQLARLAAAGEQATLVPSFPCVTCPVQAAMTTGTLPGEHGVVANGFYWRDKREIEMWTAWNDCILRPQIWDRLHERDSAITSAVWFPLHSKGCGADYICTPAPIHNPDGSESLWCYTKPTELYGELRDTLGHFPLAAFLGADREYQVERPGSSTRRDSRGPRLAARFLLYLSAALGLCRAEERAGQRRGHGRAYGARWSAGAADCGICRSIWRACATVARGQRIHDRAGQSRDIS